MDEAHQVATGYSPAATAIAHLFVERSEHGLFADPQCRVGELAQETDLSIEDTHDAIDELSDFVEMSDSLVEISQKYVSAKEPALLNSTVIGNRGILPKMRCNSPQPS